MTHNTHRPDAQRMTTRRRVLQAAGAVGLASGSASGNIGGDAETDEWPPGATVEDVERIRWRDDGAHLEDVHRIEFRADGGFFGIGGSDEISVNRVSFQ